MNPTTLSDLSATSLRLLRPLRCQNFNPSPPLISYHISVAKASSIHSSNKYRHDIEKSEEKSTSPSPSNIIRSREESRLTEELRTLIDSGNYSKSISVVESICAKGHQLDSHLCYVLLTRLADAPDHERTTRLVELLEAEGKQNKHVYNLFIGCLCKAGRVVAAFEALGRMRARGFHPKTSPHNSIVKALCKHKMLEAALATAEHFRTEYRCPPNWVAYGNIIECAIVTRGVEEVPALLHQMARDGLGPDNFRLEAMHSRIVHNLCKSRKVDEALEFINYLPNGSGPHATSYIILLRLFLILGKKQDAESVIDEMLIRLRKLKLSHFRAIIRLLIANGLLRRAREMIDAAIWKFGLGADMLCCSELIAAYLEDKRMDLVIDLIDFMTSREQYPTVVVYNTIISGLCNLGNTKEALDILDNMSSLGVPPIEATYNRIIGGLWSNGEIITAVKMLERMVNKDGFGLNVITYNVIMSGLTKDGLVDEGLEVLRVMECNGIAADVITYNTLLLGFCKAARMEEAMQLFEEMLDKGCEPQFNTYQIILKGAISAGYKAEVVNLLNEMNEKDILSEGYVTLLKDDLLLDCTGDSLT